ncbi:MAG: hypothetical protein IPM61_16820 [Chlorobi bacterium]|nr:hypothetical protein [Chlorobiota bacterium]
MQNLLFLTKAKEHLSLADNALDGDVTRWIELASSVVEDYCEQPIGKETTISSIGNIRFQFAGTGRTTKVHGYHPATVVKLEYQDEVGDAWTEIPSSEYDAIELNEVPVLRYLGGFDPGLTYRATLLVGYTVGTNDGNTEIPMLIQRCMLDLVTEAWKQSEQGARRFGLKQESATDGAGLGGRTTIFLEVEPAWKKRLAEYKRRGV